MSHQDTSVSVGITISFRLLLLTVLLRGCACDRNPAASSPDYKYRRSAWESLSNEERSTVTGIWQRTPVESCNYCETGQSAICVTFNTTMDALLGPIVVYIEPDSYEILGYALRD